MISQIPLIEGTEFARMEPVTVPRTLYLAARWHSKEHCWKIVWGGDWTDPQTAQGMTP
jgi:hypothetical protein